MNFDIVRNPGWESLTRCLRTCQRTARFFDMPGQRGSPGESIRFLRKLAGMSLEDVATAADTSVAYLSKVENAKFDPSLQYVAKVTAAIAAHLREAA